MKRRYVRKDKIEKLEKEGWKVVDSDFSDVSKNRTSANHYKNSGDVVLMEKEG